MQHDAEAERVDFIEARFDALLGVAAQLFPRIVLGTGAQDEWLVAGPALIARATRSLAALRALRPHGLDCDAYTVLRSLYELLTRFAFIAANPSVHGPLWFKWDRLERLKADNDMMSATGEAFIDAAARGRFVAEQAALDGQLPALREQAEKADVHWSAQIEGFGMKGQSYGFAGMYRGLYRHSSGIVHGTAYGLQTLIQRGPPGTLIVGRELRGVHDPYSLGQIVYMAGMLVFAAAFNVDGLADALEAINVQCPYESPPSWA